MKIWKPEDPLPGEDVFRDEETYDKSWIFEDPQSEEIIKQLGFDKPTAAHLWRRWSEWAEEGGSEFDCATRDVPFLALIKGRVIFSEDVWGDDDAAWIRWMQKHGIATELQDAIMDPRFKQLRLTRTCEQWVLDTIDMRYETFYESEVAEDLQGHEYEPSSNTVASDSGLAHEETPGVTVLYKAIVLKRYKSKHRNLLNSEGRLNHLRSLKTYLGSEFSDSKAMIHLETSLKTAQLRASYLKRLSNGLGQEVVIIRLSIPETIKQDMSVEIYFPSDDWKKLIWYCRTRKCDRKLREEISHLYSASLIVGNMASAPEAAFRKLNSWEEITEEHVLKLHGPDEKEVQYVFDGDCEGKEILREHVTGVKILPYSTEEYLEWMEGHKGLPHRDIARSHCCLQ